jgi:hypothetical protein
MLRHSVIWRLRDTTTPELRVEMLKGLAYLRMECLMVRSGDYGDDLFGGSLGARAGRLPTWRREGDGPSSDYDVALHLDFDDWAGHDAYSADPAHNAGSKFNASVAWDELTARVDWDYPGDLTGRRGHIRHVAMFVWADEASEGAKRRAFDAVRALAEAPGVEAVAVGPNIGKLVSDYDWIMDVQLPDRAAAERMLGGAPYARAMESVAGATKYEWTARLSHVMRGP